MRFPILVRSMRRKHRAGWLLLGAILVLGGCANLGTVEAPPPARAYLANGNGVFARYAPLFAHENDALAYNRIGRPIARTDDRNETVVSIDPTRPVIFAEQRGFAAKSGVRYTNLIYRVHFAQTPVQFIPFHVTAGRNVGLLVIVTVNAAGEPVLYTTVHTCGCYAAFVPTSFLPTDALPQDWPAGKQRVWGEWLPTMLALSTPFDGQQRPLIRLRDGTHRVMDVQATRASEARIAFRPVATPIEPITNLKRLPLGDGETVSLFHTGGFREGYVRETFKPFEVLLVSWWALDINAGTDKDYGTLTDTGRKFYTSFRPWKRAESDMRDFARFLTHWGWRL